MDARIRIPGKLTSVGSCRQAALDMNLNTFFRRAGAASTGVASLRQFAPTGVRRAGAAPTGVASCRRPAGDVYLFCIP